MASNPPPPPGFQLEQSGIPAPPAGFQIQQAGQSREELSTQFYQALADGRKDDARQIIGYVQQHGMTIAPPNAQQTDAAFQKANAQNVAAQSPIQTALQGAGKAFVDTGRGIGELLGVESPQDVANARQADQALMNTTAGQLGYGGGMVAQAIGGAALGGIAAGAPALAGLTATTPTLGGALASGALSGTVYGTIAPYASEGEHIANTAGGALLGPLLAGGAKGVQLAARGGKALLDRYLAPDTVAATRVGSALANDGASPAVLRAGADAVPGVKPTLAQVMQTPTAVQLERAARNNPISGPEIAAQDVQNMQARMNLLENHAGFETVGSLLDQTPMDALTANRLTRAANFKNFADQNLTESVPFARWSGAKDAFQNVLDQRPRMSGADLDAIKGARKIVAQVRGGSLQEDDAMPLLQELGDSVSSKAAQNAFSDAYGAIDKNTVDPKGILTTIAKIKNGPLGINPQRAADLDLLSSKITGAMNTRGRVGTNILDAVRQEASRILGNANDQSTIAYGPAKQAIVNAIDDVSPGYRAAVQKYAEQSQPINTAETVRGLLDPTKSTSTEITGEPLITAARIKSALGADDAARFNLSPQARHDLERVQASLQSRNAAQRSIGPMGSPTEENRLNQLVSQGARHIGATSGALGGTYVAPGVGTVAGALLGHGADILDRYAQNRIAGSAGRLLMDPNASADALDRYLLLQGRRQAFNDALVPVGQYGGIAGLLASPARPSGGQ